MQSKLLIIGTEVCSGFTKDKNGYYLSKELSQLGIEILSITTIPDKKESIINFLENNKECELIIICGGLGPTKDDITRETLSEYFKEPLHRHPLATKNLENYFNAHNKIPSEASRNTELIPKSAIPLTNTQGTACGLFFDKEKQQIFVLPGFPDETENIFKNEIKKRLEQSINEKCIQKVLFFKPIGETKIQKLLDSLPLLNKISYSILPSKKHIRVIFRSMNQNLINECTKNLLNITKSIIQTTHSKGNNPENTEKLLNTLMEKNLKISFAESCTGGLLASSLIALPNASRVISESYITYSNLSKEKILDVNPKNLALYGAVSKEVVSEMLNGLKKISKSDINIAISGIAGPSGGTPQKPVGTIFYGINILSKVIIEKIQLQGTRNEIQCQIRDYIFKKILTILSDSFL